MSEKLTQPTSESVATSEKKRDRNTRQARKRSPLPSVVEILSQLHELVGAVAIGHISTRQASLMQRTLCSILQVQLKRETRDDAGPASQDGLIEACRNDPKLLNTLEAFLTDAQVEQLMSEIADSPDESF